MATPSTPFRPNTRIQEPSMAGMPRYYVSQREVAAEYEPPARGAVLGVSFGSQYKDHIVLEASIAPKDNKRILTIVHCAPPDWQVLLGSLDRSSGNGEHLYQRQVVPTPSQATIEADHLSTYDPIDETKSVKTTKVPRRKKSDGTYEDGYPVKQEKQKGVENLTPAKFRGLVTAKTTVDQVTLGAADVNNIPDPATPSGNETVIKHTKVNDWRYEKAVTEEVIDENALPLPGQETDTWGVNHTAEQLVDKGTAADSGFGVKSSRVTPLGNNKSVKETVNFPETTAVLVGTEIDEVTGAVVRVTKELVPSGTVGSSSDDTIVEVQPIDAWHSVKITSQLISPPQGYDWKTTHQLRLPPSLKEVKIVWNSNISTSKAANGVNNQDKIIKDKMSWAASAEASVQGYVAGSAVLSFEPGFSGVVPVNVTRRFDRNPSVDPSHLTVNSTGGYGSITIIGHKAVTKQRCESRGVGDINTSNDTMNFYDEDKPLSIQNFGPVANYGAKVSVVGTPSRNASAVAIGGSVPGGFYPTAQASLTVEGKYEVSLPPVIPRPSGIRTLRVSVSPWRFGYFAIDTYTYEIPQ